MARQQFEPHAALARTLLVEVVGQLALGAKGAGAEGHVLLGLRVEGWVLDQAVDEDPDVVLGLV